MNRRQASCRGRWGVSRSAGLLALLVGVMLWMDGGSPEADAGAPGTALAAEESGSSAERRAAITFAVNVHDFVNLDESADTVLRLVDLFERWNVRGDFYLTAPMVALYQEQRPEVIERLKQSAMTISYHVRPPHPLIAGFDAPLRGLEGDALVSALREYETHRLDLETGTLDITEPGGYTYVRDVFGRAPVVASVPSALYRSESLEVFAELGARMTVIYHETGTKIEQPFEYAGGLLIRPSDWSVTRWAADGSTKEQFWWAMLDTPLATDYHPTRCLEERLRAWTADRAPIVTALIHDDNFYREAATPWALIYYTDAQKETARRPPFDLEAPDPSRPRSLESQEAVWSAYETLVAYAAANLDVVTSEDLVERAAEALGAVSDLDMTEQIRQLTPSAPLCDDVSLELPGWDERGYGPRR